MNKQQLIRVLKEQLDLKGNYNDYLLDSKQRINAVGNFEGMTLALSLIDQLEEPNEIELSEPSAWRTIAKLYHPNEVYWGNVRDSYIESLDKQEKVVVNKRMAGHIENCKNLKLTLSDSLNLVMLRDKQEEALFARAWFDGYTVEKEKRYTACFAPIGTRQGVYLYRESGSVKVGDNMKVYDKSKQEYHLTEQEIRNRDERFWDFAEEIIK